MRIYELCIALDGMKIEYKADVSLKERSTFRIGGVGELGIFPDTAEKLASCLRLLTENEIKYRIIGNGSNILFGDGRIGGAFVFTEKMKNAYCEGREIYADAGVSLAFIAALAAKNRLTGLEFAHGIPGTVGGAIYMNAGAYGGAMSDITKYSVAVNADDGRLLEIHEHGFSYRKSVYMEKDSLACVGARFSLSCGDAEEINEKMKSFAQSRRGNQPLNFPSAGSYFKRPEENFAGKLIEDAGLKGYSLGGACVSEKHAGFIINLGNATARDVLALEEHVRETVYKRFGVILEREVRVIN